MAGLTRIFLIGLALFGTVAASNGQTPDLVKVHMTAASIESMPFLIANDLGFYKDAGINFDGRVLNTSVGVMATVAGEVDATQIVGTTIAAAIQRGVDLKVVMVFNKLPIYSLLAKKGIASYADLKGKTIASTASDTSATKILDQALTSHGVDPKEVTMFYIGSTPTIYQALIGGTVDAGTLVAPFDILAEEHGLTKLPFADRPGLLQGGVAVNGKFLRDRPDVARRFLQATQRGLHILKTDKTKSVEMMVKYIKIDASLAGKIYDESIDRFSSGGFEGKSFKDQVLSFEFGKVTPELEKQVFDFSVVEKSAGKEAAQP
jgi:NitT/TauT family transport system substrate-binding protein